MDVASASLCLSLLFAVVRHSSSRLEADFSAMDFESVCSTTIPSRIKMTGWFEEKGTIPDENEAVTGNTETANTLVLLTAHPDPHSDSP
jgi:hypothetical protein